MRATSIPLGLCLLHLTLPESVLAQDKPVGGGTKIVRVARVDSPPTIDGRLDEAVWGQADVIDDFHQIRPGDGAEPSETTEVYLLYSSDALYIGARMYDSEPDRIAAPTVRHGQGLGSDDRLVVILDPFNTGRSGYRFETNLNGVRHDALYESVSAFQSNWTVIWDVATSVFEHGWMAELEIPFKTLPFDPTIDTWGFNFGRGIRRRGEEVAWVSRNRTYNPSILGLATGFEGMDQGLGLDVVPSVSINGQRAASGASDSSFEPSLDLFYRLTSSLNASLTVNTDFSATEVDDRQVNLTRFSLFFPEKRDFFLNDADLFEFGGIGGVGNGATSGSSTNNGRPFFSRRLGLSARGTPVNLQYGGKLSGRVGRWNVGALAVRQDEFEDIRASTALVARVSANVLAESSAGMIVTHGDPNSNRDNALVGFDFRYLNTRLPGGRVVEADAWFQETFADEPEDNDSAFGLGVRLPNNSGWRGGVGVKALQANFDPALGFVSRAGVRDTTIDVGYTHFTGGSFLQSMFVGLDAQHIGFLEGGGLQSQVILGRLLEIRTNTGELASAHYGATREVVTEPFTIYEDNSQEVVVPPGRYSFGERVLSVRTGGQRPVSGGVTYRSGDFFNGTRDGIGGDVSWRQFNNFALTFSYDRNAVSLPQGEFVTRLMRLSTEVNFSSTLYWVNLIQYDDVSEVLGVNVRLHWIPRAGREALIVLNQSLQDKDKDNSFASELRDLTVKLSYTIRF